VINAVNETRVSNGEERRSWQLLLQNRGPHCELKDEPFKNKLSPVCIGEASLLGVMTSSLFSDAVFFYDCGSRASLSICKKGEQVLSWESSQTF
jgi:hypothetical protein